MGRTVSNLGLTPIHVVKPGDVFHYTGYGILIQSVPIGAPVGGLQTDEGPGLLLGTVYQIISGAGTGEVWKTTGPNTAVQIVAPPPAETAAAPPTLPPAPGAPAPAGPSWFDQTTALPGVGPVPNTYLVLGGALIAVLILKRKK